jgi:hypothetical protein
MALWKFSRYRVPKRFSQNIDPSVVDRQSWGRLGLGSWAGDTEEWLVGLEMLKHSFSLMGMGRKCALEGSSSQCMHRGMLSLMSQTKIIREAPVIILNGHDARLYPIMTKIS